MKPSLNCLEFNFFIFLLVPIKLIQSTVGPNVIVAILLHSAQPPLIVLVNSKSKVVLSLPIQLLFDIYCINSLKLTSLAACTFVYTTWQLLSIRAFNGIRLYHPTLFQFQYVEPPTHLLPPAHPLPPTQVFPFTVQCEGYAVTKNQRCKTKIKITRAEQEHYCLKHVHQPQKRKDLSLRYNCKD
ncbi:hypothetical protein BD560DRAFT_13224 [Blakeslea trispora]|nr:hypothetical protein BD560DRAFT_13224 [Blakeslea trispora]